MEYKETFAERLKGQMALRGINQKALAEKLGIGQQAISHWTTGKRSPDVEMLTNICTALNVSADYLLGIHDTPSPNAEIQGIAKATGLTERAVEVLASIQGFCLDLKAERKEANAMIDAFTAIDLLNFILENERFFTTNTYGYEDNSFGLLTDLATAAYYLSGRNTPLTTPHLTNEQERFIWNEGKTIIAAHRCAIVGEDVAAESYLQKAFTSLRRMIEEFSQEELKEFMRQNNLMHFGKISIDIKPKQEDN